MFLQYRNAGLYQCWCFGLFTMSNNPVGYVVEKRTVFSGDTFSTCSANTKYPIHWEKKLNKYKIYSLGSIETIKHLLSQIGAQMDHPKLANLLSDYDCHQEQNTNPSQIMSLILGATFTSKTVEFIVSNQTPFGQKIKIWVCRPALF